MILPPRPQNHRPLDRSRRTLDLPATVGPPPPQNRPELDRFAAPPWNPQSPEWLAIEDSLPADHLARAIDEAVDQLDLTPLFASYLGVGSKAHRPDLMLKIVLYEIQTGHHSPDSMGERHVRSSLPSVAGIGDRAVAQPLVCLPRPGRATAGDLSSSDPGRGRGAGPDHRQSWLPGRHADRRPCLAASPGQPLPTAAAVGGVGPRHRRRQDPPGSRSDPRVDGAPSRDPTAATLPLP